MEVQSLSTPCKGSYCTCLTMESTCISMMFLLNTEDRTLREQTGKAIELIDCTHSTIDILFNTNYTAPSEKHFIKEAILFVT